MATFEDLVLKDYPLWTLYLSSKQYYLGRAYAWLKRPGEMQRLTELTLEEQDEFMSILHDYEHAVGHLWTPAHMNYAWLGNEFGSHKGHGHMHIIPRYDSAREFAGVKFVDEQWGHNYAPAPVLELPDAKLFQIRDALRQHFI